MVVPFPEMPRLLKGDSSSASRCRADQEGTVTELSERHCHCEQYLAMGQEPLVPWYAGCSHPIYERNRLCWDVNYYPCLVDIDPSRLENG